MDEMNYNVEEEMELNIPEETDLEVIDMPPQEEDCEPSKASKGLMLAGAVGISVGVYKLYKKIAPKLRERKLKKARKILEEEGISVIEPVSEDVPEPRETTEGQDEDETKEKE